MKFTGKNLDMVHVALSEKVDDMASNIAACPDPIRYAESLARLDAKRLMYVRLLTKVNKALTEAAFPDTKVKA